MRCPIALPPLAAVLALACSRGEPGTAPARPDDRAAAAAVGSGTPSPTAATGATPGVQGAPAAADAARIEITVNEAGFSPQEVKVKRGRPTTLVFTRVTDRTCITAIDIPAEQVAKLELPLNRPASVTITPASAGVEAFHCSAMAMGGGRILVEE